MSSNSNAENNIMSNNFPSLCIPRVYPNIKEERIRKIFQELALGELERIDIVNKTSEKGEKFNRVFIHFKTWYAEGNAEVARKRLIEGKDIKIIYDDPWFWKVSAYKERVQKPLPEKKPVKPKVTLIIESDDEEPAAAYNRDDRRPRDNYEQRPRDDRRPHYDERRPAKPNDSFKKTKKEDFNNNIAPALSSPMVLLASKPNPVVVKEEQVAAVKPETLEDFTAFEPVLIKITPENAAQYIGENVIFKHDGKCFAKQIQSVSATGKSIRVNCPEVENSLQIVTRNVYLNNGAIIPSAAEKPRIIKSKEQKEKEKKANQLLVKHTFSPEV